jgi:hypothetical protein
MVNTKMKIIVAVAVLLNMLVVLPGKTQAQQTAGNIEQTGESKPTSLSAEKIYIHTDKEEYLAGEMLWLKTYLVNGASLKPVTYNSVVYTEVLDSKGRSVLQGKILTGKNEGDGCFYLPTNLVTGSYTVLAYTTAIKKNDIKFYFRKRIRIINTFTAIPAVKTQQKSANAFVNFYPEGGNVLSGEQTKFGFCVLDPFTKRGLQARGIITNRTNDTLATFTTLQFGLGQVSFKPAKDEKYTATIYLADGSIIRKELPAAEPNGYSLSVQDSPNDKLTITSRLRPENQNGYKEKAFLVIHSHQTSRMVIEMELDSRSNKEYSVDRSKIGVGVIYFTLINAKGQPVCERLTFIPPAKPTASINIELEKKEFAQREKIKVGLNLKSQPEGGTGIFNGSISIVHADPASTSAAPNIYEHFWLSGDLYGEIESPGFYFTAQAQTNPAYIENLMLVHGWRRFSNTQAASKPILELFPEYTGHIITARVLDSWSNTPKSGVHCTLSVPSSPLGFYTAASDSNGIARFSVQNYLGPGSIVVKATSAITPNPYKVEIIDPFAITTGIDSLTPGFTLSRTDSIMLLQRSIGMQATNTYQHDQVNKFILPLRTDTFPFFGKPELSYSLDNYTRFSTMEEVLREYVAPITVALKGSKLQLSIYDDKYQRYYNDNILVLLDGVPLSDFNQIFNYDPYKIKKIDVVPRRYLYGSNSYFGIASFETYKGQFDATEIDPSSILIDYEGLQLKREFYSPVYGGDDKGNPRIPDYRTTLLWIPNVELINNAKKEIESYSSDFPGTYQVVICGITAAGNPVQETVSFKVQ